MLYLPCNLLPTNLAWRFSSTLIPWNVTYPYFSWDSLFIEKILLVLFSPCLNIWKGKSAARVPLFKKKKGGTSIFYFLFRGQSTLGLGKKALDKVWADVRYSFCSVRWLRWQAWNQEIWVWVSSRKVFLFFNTQRKSSCLHFFTVGTSRIYPCTVLFVNCVTSLGLSFLICNMGLMVLTLAISVVGKDQGRHEKRVYH